MMFIYECNINLHENTFFSSREINNFYQTEALIGNYALTYAFGFANAPYNNNTILYEQHFSKLNEQGIYLTPAKAVGKTSYAISQFNSTSETYWSKVEQNAISTDIGVKTNPKKKARAVNLPQIGKIKMLALNSKFKSYILSQNPIRVPQYIRLGKFMSKAKVEVKEFNVNASEEISFVSNVLLNPIDLSDNTQLGLYDLYSVHPTPLIDNARLISTVYKLPDGTLLPTDMKYGVEGLSK